MTGLPVPEQLKIFFSSFDAFLLEIEPEWKNVVNESFLEVQTTKFTSLNFETTSNLKIRFEVTDTKTDQATDGCMGAVHNRSVSHKADQSHNRRKLIWLYLCAKSVDKRMLPLEGFFVLFVRLEMQ